MTDVMDGVKAKVARALEHLIELDDQMHEYLDYDPLDLQRQIQPDGETSVFAMVVKAEPPIGLALLVGEVVHQLRSALDHLANHLVVVAGNTPTRRTTFPVLLQRSTKPFAVEGGVGSIALAAIEQLQPYHRQSGADEHPLAILQELWNADKHRRLSLTAAMLADSQIFVADPEGQYLVGGQFQSGPLGDNGIMGIFAFADGGPSDDAEVHAGGRIFVAFAEEGPWSKRPITEVLEELHRYVAVTVIPRLEACC